MSERDSDVPLDLKRALENTPSTTSMTKPGEVLPPAEWPPCPACGDRLSLSSVATGRGDAVIAARYICPGCPEFEYTPQFVYGAVTDELHFDQAPEPTRMGDDE